MLTTVYRVGALPKPEAAPACTSSARELTKEFDTLRPAGRPPKAGSIYAGPTWESVVRWWDHRRYHRDEEHPPLLKLTVEADDLFVYDLTQWYRHDALNYWYTATPLTKWQALQAQGKAPYEYPREVEVLLSHSSLHSWTLASPQEGAAFHKLRQAEADQEAAQEAADQAYCEALAQWKQAGGGAPQPSTP